MIMSTKSSYIGSHSSQGSHRFRDSNHTIPAADSNGKRAKRFDPWIMNFFVVVGIPISMLGLAIALEIGLHFSTKLGGFKVPPKNVIEIVSSQFLLAFVPTILVAPYAFMWRELDWMLRWYQPYIVLWKGNSTAEESLLLDYIALGPALAVFRALKYKHRIILWSSFTAITTYIFQPLAGSIFQVRQRPKPTELVLNSTRVIGFDPKNSNIQDLSAFAAAAGYAGASAYHGLPDPPFIQRGWTTAEFLFPNNNYLNGSMALNTTGIQTQPNCATPKEFNLTPLIDGNFSINATSAEGCRSTATFNPDFSTMRYGIAACEGTTPENVPFSPVMFWFFHTRDGSSPEAKSVFCSPTIKLFNVNLTANLDTQTLSSVTPINDYVTENTVTGGDLHGRAFNGLVFVDPKDDIIAARASTIRSLLSGAIFQSAVKSSLGLQGTFDLPNGFLDLTIPIYRQHLAVTALSIYFVDQNSTLKAEVTSFVPVLWIDALPAHALALALFFTGFAGVILQLIHRRDRKKLLLAAPPGSIAAVMSLTARSGFGELLLPYDDERTLEKKLDGLRFRMDRRTGAIVADEDGTERDFMGPDDAMMSLLGQHHQREAMLASTSASSSTLAQVAAEYPPWVGPLKTPYDR